MLYYMYVLGQNLTRKTAILALGSFKNRPYRWAGVVKMLHLWAHVATSSRAKMLVVAGPNIITLMYCALVVLLDAGNVALVKAPDALDICPA